MKLYTDILSIGITELKVVGLFNGNRSFLGKDEIYYEEDI